MDDVSASNVQIPPSKASLRPFESYFDEINSEEKAYWLGFILADGCVLWNEKTRNYGLQVALQSADIDHLIMLERGLGGSRSPEIDQMSRSAKLMRYSKYMASRLIDIGICPRKSSVDDLPLPKFPASLAQHFWRGLFDGDGSLTTQMLDPNLVLNFRISVAGSRVILEEFQRWSENRAGIRRQKVVRARNNQGDTRTYVLYLGGNRQVAALTGAPYQDCSRML